MKELGRNINENSLWRRCFPYYAEYSGAAGIYTIRTLDEVKQDLCTGWSLRDPILEADARLELAIISLWPEAKEEFVCDLFPHMLAAATDVLRAMDFGEGRNSQQQALVQELTDALNHCEMLHAALAQQAAEKADRGNAAELRNNPDEPQPDGEQDGEPDGEQ